MFRYSQGKIMLSKGNVLSIQMTLSSLNRKMIQMMMDYDINNANSFSVATAGNH